MASVVKSDTILAWHRKLVAQEFDGSQQRKAAGRPTIDKKLDALVVRLARENRTWGSDRIVGALAYLGHTISAQAGQYHQAAWDSTRSRAEEDHDLARVHSRAHGGPCRDGFLHG